MPLTVMIFVIGFFPNIFLSRMHDAVARVTSDLQARLDQHPAPRFYEGPIRLQPRRPDAPKSAAQGVAENP
jgi:hypothetical protein